MGSGEGSERRKEPITIRFSKRLAAAPEQCEVHTVWIGRLGQLWNKLGEIRYQKGRQYRGWIGGSSGNSKCPYLSVWCAGGLHPDGSLETHAVTSMAFETA